MDPDEVAQQVVELVDKLCADMSVSDYQESIGASISSLQVSMEASQGS